MTARLGASAHHAGLGARPAFGQRAPRPTRVVVPVLAAALSLGGWAAVAHNSGSGWVQALGALLGGFLAVGLLGPGLVTWRLAVMVVDAPLDGVAGRPVAVVVTSNLPIRVTPLRPSGSDVVLDGRGPGTVLVVPSHHCELRTCRLRVASAAPFGLLWWYRDLEVPLVRPVLVAPKLARPDPGHVSESAGVRRPNGGCLNDSANLEASVSIDRAISDTGCTGRRPRTRGPSWCARWKRHWRSR